MIIKQTIKGVWQMAASGKIIISASVNLNSALVSLRLASIICFWQWLTFNTCLRVTQCNPYLQIRVIKNNQSVLCCWQTSSGQLSVIVYMIKSWMLHWFFTNNLSLIYRFIIQDSNLLFYDQRSSQTPPETKPTGWVYCYELLPFILLLFYSSGLNWTK